MLFSISSVLRLALLCHTAASLSLPAVPGVASLTRRTSQAQDPSQYSKEAAQKIRKKAKDIKKHYHEDKAQVLIETDLQIVVQAFKSYIQGMNDCNCTRKGEIDLEHYKKLVIEVFASVQVVIEVIVGTQDQTLIKSAQDVFSQFKVHVAKLVDLVIKVDIKIAVAVRDNVDATAYAVIGVDIVELVNGKVAEEVSGQAGTRGKPVVTRDSKGGNPVDDSNPKYNNTGKADDKQTSTGHNTGHH
ncbi:secreted protein [Melampsora americana]|nr:secreted protein [Melampsora americana]